MKKLNTLGVLSLGIIFLAGCGQQPTDQNQLTTKDNTVKTYNTQSFSVDYPANFEAKEENIGVMVLAISNSKGKIQIGDFEPAATPGPQPGMTQEQIDQFPKDTVYHGYDGEIASALFYKTGDDETMQELKKIQESIKLK